MTLALVAEEPCQVNRAVRDALRDAEAEYAERGILIVPLLSATTRLRTHEDVLYQSVYTIFRGLPARLPRGAVLYVATEDRAGGDVELTWEAREEPGAKAAADDDSSCAAREEDEVAARLRQGPYGDLFEVALLGLDALCRSRGVLMERHEEATRPTTSILDLSPKVRRRYAFLIPSLERGPAWHPKDAP